jgi:hypothetical protein
MKSERVNFSSAAARHFLSSRKQFANEEVQLNFDNLVESSGVICAERHFVEVKKGKSPRVLSLGNLSDFEDAR